MFSLISMGASSLVVPSRAGTVSMAFPDNSWRKSYDGKGGVAAGPAVNASPTAFTLGGGGGGAAPAARAAAPAATGGATVVQAMKFMQDPSVTNMPVKITSQTHDWRTPVTDAVELRWQVEAKAAFLASKGVDAYAISQAACVSGGMYECFGPVQTEKYA
jgi:hypothetical protein